MSGDGPQGSAASAGSAEAAGGSSAGGSSNKVDAIWQQLKSAHKAPKAQAVNFNKLWQGFSSDPVQGSIKLAAKPPQQQGSYQAELMDGASRPPPDPAQRHPQQQAPVASAKPDPATALQLVARCVAGLKDSSQSARRKALQDVQSQLLDNPALGEQWLAERLESDGLGKALLRRFDDPADSCREMAVTNLLRLLQAAPQAVLSLLPYAFPVMSERIRHKEEGSRNLTEPCEEVRLALARLLHALVTLGAKSFGGYAAESVDLVAALCEDPFHEVQEEACAIVVAMNDVLGLRLQPISKQLVAALLPLTTAKRHRVRIAALQALRPTLHQGAHEMVLEMVAWRDPNVIAIKAFYGDDLKVNFCGKLAADPHPTVRREFLAALADWMTSLRERLDHESRLLPYVLSALNDESPEIQADAVALLERLGVQYEADHEKDLKDTLSYLPEEAHGIGWQAPGAAGYVYGNVAAGEETVNGGRAVFVLPGPLRSRPRLGTRRLVQSNFGRIVGALSDEVTSWLLEARRRAAALLRTQLVLTEEWSEQHLHLLLPALCKAISDPEVRTCIRDCCAVVGAFTDPELALQLLQPRVADEAAELAQRAAALEVLACVVRGAGPRRALDAHLPGILELLCQESLLTSEDTRVRRALLEVVEQLVSTCGPACSRHAAPLLWVCLYLRSPGRVAQAPQTAAMAAAAGAAAAVPTEAGGEAAGAAVEATVMQRLAEVCGFSGGVDEMVEAHRQELLSKLDPGSTPNALLATGVLCRLMLPHGSQSYLLYLPDEVLGRVLPPEPPYAPERPRPAPMDVDAAAGGGAALADRQAAGTAASASGRHWQPSSTAAVLQHLCTDLAWLARQPRCATMCMVCLEACLEACLEDLPASHQDDGVVAQAGGEEELVAVLAQALVTCQELTPPALLATLRCVHVVLRRGLVSEAVLTGHLGELVQRLAACMAVVSGAPCRLQACFVMQMLLGSRAAAAAVRAGAAQEGPGGIGVEGAGGNGAAVLQDACAAISARLYDSSDEARCAALGLAREVVGVATVGDGAMGLAGGAGGAPARLVSEIAQLRDVSPGSIFFDEYRAFCAWASDHMPAIWRGAGADGGTA